MVRLLGVTFAALLLVAACSSSSAGGDAGAVGMDGAADAGQGGGPAMEAGAGGEAGEGDGGVGGGDSALTCPERATAEQALLVKTCAAPSDCAVTVVQRCCGIYTGIRADKKSAFEAAQSDYLTACPSLSGCGCADHTETNDSVPNATVQVVATCDNGACTAHVPK